MKKILLVVLALVMALTLVMGSVSTVSAEAPPKVELNIIRVSGDYIYYDFSWREAEAYGYVVSFKLDGQVQWEIREEWGVSTVKYNSPHLFYKAETPGTWKIVVYLTDSYGGGGEIPGRYAFDEVTK